ncbi:MAG: hypothetical protein GWP35_10685 [Proteobacteria bacterium]|nr:hypothetical protein [Pseudomonadota bacterium]
MSSSKVFLCVLLASFGLCLTASGQPLCDVTYFLTVSEGDDILRTVEASSMTVEIEMSLSSTAFEVDSVRGLAIDPVTGLFYMLGIGTVPPNPPSATPILFYYDPVGLFVSPVGSTLLDFNDLAFLPSGEIRAITNPLANGAANYCELSLLTGGPIDLCNFPVADSGESIGINGNGQLYRASGGGAFDSRLQGPSNNPSGDPCDVLTVTIPPELISEPVRTITWWEAEGAFVWVSGDAARSIYLLEPSGIATLIGNADHDINGLAIVTLATPCPVGGDQFIRGDCNLDLGVNVADAIFLLSSLFVPGSSPLGCRDTGDVNDDGGVNVADAVFLLSGLFIPGSVPVPFPSIIDGCGSDPTDDGLDCLPPGCP